MKKILYFTSMMLFTVVSINAQVKWDLGNGDAAWPTRATGYTANVVNANLGLQPGPATVTNFGKIVATPAPSTFPDDLTYTAVNRFELNGGGKAVGFMPTERFVYFAVEGSGTVKVYFRAAGAGSRILYVTDGTRMLGSFLASTSAQGYILTVPYTNVNGNLYVYGDNGFNLFKIEVSGKLGETKTFPTLGTSAFEKEADVTVYAKGSKIFLSNVQSATSVAVYSVTGSLVQSVETSGDTSLDVTSGVYVVKTQSAEGSKTAKVIVQ